MSRNVKITHRELLCDPMIAQGYLSEAIETRDARIIDMAYRNILEVMRWKEEQDNAPTSDN